MSTLLPALSMVLLMSTVSIHGAVAQGPACTDVAGFVRTVGTDTLAIERVRQNASGIDGYLHFPGERVRARYFVTLDTARGETLMELALWPPDTDTTAAPAQAGELLLTADSATFVVMRSGESQRTRSVVPRGTMPGFQLATGLEELVLERARAARRSMVDVPVYYVGTGGWTPVAHVEFAGTDSATVQLDRSRMRLRTDAAGRLLGATVESEGDAGPPVRITRVDCATVETLLRRR